MLMGATIRVFEPMRVGMGTGKGIRHEWYKSDGIRSYEYL